MWEKAELEVEVGEGVSWGPNQDCAVVTFSDAKLGGVSVAVVPAGAASVPTTVEHTKQVLPRPCVPVIVILQMPSDCNPKLRIERGLDRQDCQARVPAAARPGTKVEVCEKASGATGYGVTSEQSAMSFMSVRLRVVPVG